MKVILGNKIKRKLKKIEHKDISLYRDFQKNLDNLRFGTNLASLKIHKLSGYKDSVWSFSVNYSIRAVFVFVSNGQKGILLIDIGSHDEVY